jgi:hypothetical protein
MGVGDKRHASAALPSARRPGIHCREGWCGPQGWSGRLRKISHTPGFDSRTVQPVASRYTDWASAAHQTFHSFTTNVTWTGLESNRVSAVKGPRLIDVALNGTVTQLSWRLFYQAAFPQLFNSKENEISDWPCEVKNFRLGERNGKCRKRSVDGKCVIKPT